MYKRSQYKLIFVGLTLAYLTHVLFFGSQIKSYLEYSDITVKNATVLSSSTEKQKSGYYIFVRFKLEDGNAVINSKGKCYKNKLLTLKNGENVKVVYPKSHPEKAILECYYKDSFSNRTILMSSLLNVILIIIIIFIYFKAFIR